MILPDTLATRSPARPSITDLRGLAETIWMYSRHTVGKPDDLLALVLRACEIEAIALPVDMQRRLAQYIAILLHRPRPRPAAPVTAHALRAAMAVCPPNAPVLYQWVPAACLEVLDWPTHAFPSDVDWVSPHIPARDVLPGVDKEGNQALCVMLLPPAAVLPGARQDASRRTRAYVPPLAAQIDTVLRTEIFKRVRNNSQQTVRAEEVYALAQRCVANGSLANPVSVHDVALQIAMLCNAVVYPGHAPFVEGGHYLQIETLEHALRKSEANMPIYAEVMMSGRVQPPTYALHTAAGVHDYVDAVDCQVTVNPGQMKALCMNRTL